MSSPSDILNALHNDTLQDLYLKEHEDERGSKLSKHKMVTSITDAIEASGVKSLLANIKRDDLKKVADEAKVQLKDKDNPKSKTVLTKKLSALISGEGLNDFLNEHLTVGTLKTIAADLDLKASDKKEDLVSEIGEAVRTVGTETYFSSFDVDLLQDVAEDLGLKTVHTNNKRKLVECIVSKEDAPKEPKAKKPKVPEFSAKKKAIQKGTTYEDIFQHYYVGEVRDWCREHGLKTSGKKGVLIRRVLAFLEGDEDSTKAHHPGKGKAKANGGKAAKKEEEKEEHKEEKQEEDDEKKGGKKGGK